MGGRFCEVESWRASPIQSHPIPFLASFHSRLRCLLTCAAQAASRRTRTLSAEGVAREKNARFIVTATSARQRKAFRFGHREFRKRLITSFNIKLTALFFFFFPNSLQRDAQPLTPRVVLFFFFLSLKQL